MTTPTALAIAGAVGVALYFIHKGATPTALPVSAPSPSLNSSGGWRVPVWTPQNNAATTFAQSSTTQAKNGPFGLSQTPQQNSPFALSMTPNKVGLI